MPVPTQYGNTDPARGHIAVTPSDVTVLDGVRSLYVGGTGTLVVDIAGVVETYTNAPVGYHPLQARRVLSTGTTATAIVAQL